MTWKEKIFDVLKSKRIFWRVILGFSIVVSLVTACAWLLSDLLKDIF